MRPNFLCVGTFRAGTSWLFRVLKKHPEVFLPDEKELMFFTRHYGKGIEWYEKFFDRHSCQKYAGDISPCYLSSKEAPKRIQRHLSDVKILAILRNPVDQIWSLYRLWITRNYTKKELKFALREDVELLDNVRYFEHLSNYLYYFDKKQLLVLFYEDLKANPLSFLKSLYNFLGIEEVYADDFIRIWNKSRRPKNMMIEKIIVTTGDLLRRSGMISLKTWLNKTGISDIIKSINTTYEDEQSVSEDIRSFVNTYIAQDKENLSRLVGRDLSFWK